MEIKQEEIKNILTFFPKLELSYETLAHKKVYDYDIMLAIPEGIKCFAWFYTFKDQNVCFLLELDVKKKINNINIIKCSFKDSLSFGTILYGTLLKTDKKEQCFTIEDIYYYKGKSLKNLFYYSKLEILLSLLQKELSSFILHSSFIMFALPILSFEKKMNLFLNEIGMLPYKIKEIQFRHLYEYENKISYIHFYKPGTGYKNNIPIHNKKVIFKITADIQNDIYHLHAFNNEHSKITVYDIACIPDYKTSVLMNKLFRNIKENENLDALEESDDEDEFENEKPDKFVFLQKSFKMNCVFNPKFKKWTPLHLVEKYEKIVTWKELNIIK